MPGSDPVAQTLDVPGARLYYERQGDGPLLLMIGSPMDSTGFAGLDEAPAQEAASPEQLAAMRATGEMFLAHLLRPTTQYRPDVEALLAAPARIVVAVGATSKGQLAHRSGVALADRLGTPVVEFPGDHGGFVALPEQCAQVLDQVLTQPA